MSAPAIPPYPSNPSSAEARQMAAYWARQLEIPWASPAATAYALLAAKHWADVADELAKLEARPSWPPGSERPNPSPTPRR
jgi:hypothetical protein